MRIRLRASSLLMLCVMILCERVDIFALYILSATLHELGHLLAARMLGIEISEICFDHSGVRICTEDRLIPYKKEIILAASGPLVNLSVILLSAVGFMCSGTSAVRAVELCMLFMVDGVKTTVGCGAFFALSSVIQCGINLLPVRTFDGGRILRCAAALLFGERGAERITELSSALAAFVLWTLSLYLMLRASSGLGIYVFAITVFFSAIKSREEW